MSKVKINKNFIKSIPALIEGEVQRFYWDSVLPGFGLRIGKTKTAFICEKKIQARTTRVTIGSYPQITPELARDQAQKILGQMTAGLNPNAVKKADRNKNITLEMVFRDFLESRNLLKPRTVEDYSKAIETDFKDWKYKRLLDINRDMISRRHKKLYENRGAAQANLSMRILRALFNFSQGTYFDEKEMPLIMDNPVTVLTKKRSWYRVTRKDRIVPVHKLKDWYEAVNKLPNEVTRDFLLILLFTGIRRSEAAKLRLEDVDLESRSFKVVDPKNSKPLSLPLPQPLYGIFKRRYENAINEYLFPGSGKEGYIADPKRAVNRIFKETGIKFSSHDLRRGFITIASGLVTEYELKLLVNHSAGQDVTGGYIVPNLEKLRKPMSKVVNRIFQLCTKEPAKIISINQV